ncbi:tail protein X [Lentisphaerota bacterium ZTH]|nr:tail protein X [Lentisphaerota bacterium]WET05836.1 tail protein X [Lentisphaerota bacterium ZTH]
MRYKTQDGDMLDAICFKYYGRENAIIDVLEANPHLADHGCRLTANLLIELPDLPEVEQTMVSLWD